MTCIQLYTTLVKSPENDLQHVESCMAGHQYWFRENNHLLNPDKLEVCFFGMRQKLSRMLLPPSVTVAGCPITVSDKLKILSISLNVDLTFEDYVNHIMKACNFLSTVFYPLMLLTPCGLNSWHLFGQNCNALLHDAIEKSLNKLQRVQNKLAHAICNIATLQ